MTYARIWRGSAFRLLAVCLFAALAGCAELNVPARGTHAPRPLRALDYYAWLKAVPAADIDRERGRIGTAADAQSAVVRTVSTALLWSVPLTVPSDDPLALRLLDGLEGPGQGNSGQDVREYRILGEIWREVLAERERFRTEADQNRLELERQREAVRALKQQNTDLRRQIDELKSIEQKINQRG